MAPARLQTARQALALVAEAQGIVQPARGEGAHAERIATGLEALDRLLEGGLPRGRIVELRGVRSSGRMALTLRVLAQAVARGEPAALVDAVDALEPGDLVPEARPRVLWVRPTDLLGALKSADVLLDAGGFSLVALYLVGFGSAGVPRAPVPSSAWVRLGQRAAQARTTLLVVTDGVAQCSPGAFAAVTLDARRERAVWVGARLLDAVEGEVRVVRSRASPVGRVMVR